MSKYNKYIGNKMELMVIGVVLLGSLSTLTTSCGSNSVIGINAFKKWVARHRHVHREQKDFDYIDDEWNPMDTSLVPITNQAKHADFLNYFGDLKNVSCKELVLCFLTTNLFILLTDTTTLKIKTWKDKVVDLEVLNLFSPDSENFNVSLSIYWESARNFRYSLQEVEGGSVSVSLSQNVLINNAVLSGHSHLLLFNSDYISDQSEWKMFDFYSGQGTSAALLYEWDLEYPNLKFTCLTLF